MLEGTPVSYVDQAANISLLGHFLDTGDPPTLGHDCSSSAQSTLPCFFVDPLIWPRFLWSPDCFVDVVVGFDISTHVLGQPLLHGHPWLESYLPGILEDITSIRGVSCGAGAETQVSVAFKVNNDQAFPAKFQIYQEKIFDSLLQVTVNGPTHLNAQFLKSLWDTFEDKSASKGQVCASHSMSHLHILSCVFPHPLYIAASCHSILCFPLSLGTTHLFGWPWG